MGRVDEVKVQQVIVTALFIWHVGYVRGGDPKGIPGLVGGVGMGASAAGG